MPLSALLDTEIDSIQRKKRLDLSFHTVWKLQTISFNYHFFVKKSVKSTHLKLDSAPHTYTVCCFLMRVKVHNFHTVHRTPQVLMVGLLKISKKVT